MDFSATHFLILRLSSIGDVLHATTVAHNLKLRSPGCHITWLASPPASSLLADNPDIDELLVWDRRPFDDAVLHHHFLTAKHHLDKLKPLLQKRHFDIVLDIQCLFLTGIIARMSGARKRIGIHDRHEFNHLFMTERGPEISDPHKIRHYLSVLAPLGFQAPFDPSLILHLPDSLHGFAAKFWHSRHIEPGKPLLLVNTLTSWPDKNWSAAAFAQVLDDLPADLQIVFCGAPHDAAHIEAIQKKMTHASLSIAGKASLMELAALFRSANLLLTGDTGPLYIAAAVGTPTLSLWGPTHPDIYGPLTGPHRFILSPCRCTACCKTHCPQGTNACMKAISPAVVKQELARFFPSV
jgi:3-deoxy-D-manno-octulosonic-acid transferase